MSTLKIFSFLNRLLDVLIRIPCFLLILLSAYALFDTMLVYRSAQDKSILNYKPEADTPVSGTDLGNIAWLSIDGTSIDYPVMQGNDNTEYLNKAADGSYSLAGSIFLDFRNRADFSDPYSLIYGHHMGHGAMFGALDSFRNRAWFDRHRTGSLQTAKKKYSVRLFALLETTAETDEIFQPSADSSPMEYIRKHASVFYEPSCNHLIGLSTCTDTDTRERLVVFGTLV